MYAHNGYTTSVLDLVYEAFYSNEIKARRFIAKPSLAQARMIDDFMHKNGLDGVGGLGGVE